MPAPVAQSENASIHKSRLYPAENTFPLENVILTFWHCPFVQEIPLSCPVVGRASVTAQQGRAGFRIALPAAFLSRVWMQINPMDVDLAGQIKTRSESLFAG